MGARDLAGTNRSLALAGGKAGHVEGGDTHPAAWSLHSIDIWVLNSVGADLSRAGIGRGPTHGCRAQQSLGPPPGARCKCSRARACPVQDGCEGAAFASPAVQP